MFSGLTNTGAPERGLSVKRRSRAWNMEKLLLKSLSQVNGAALHHLCRAAGEWVAPPKSAVIAGSDDASAYRNAWEARSERARSGFMASGKKANAEMRLAIVLCFGLALILPSSAMSFYDQLNAAVGKAWFPSDVVPAAAPGEQANAHSPSTEIATPEGPPPDSADEQSEAAAQPKPFVSRLSREDGSITLRGDVPSDEDKKTIQGVIAATLPGLTFVDKARISENVPDRDIWLAGMNFALRQLAKLEKGRATLHNNEITLEGSARTEQDFKLMQQKLREELPNGIVLAKSALNPPSVSPFVWLAQLQGGSVNLSGHVPLEADQDLFFHARSIFGAFHVNNSMAWALGAPKEWSEAAKISLSILNLLQQGTVILTDTVITVDGILAGPNTADQIRAMGNLLPRGFKLEANVVGAEMVPARASGAPEELNVAAKHTISADQ
jgi:hypothetical protein